MYELALTSLELALQPTITLAQLQKSVCVHIVLVRLVDETEQLVRCPVLGKPQRKEPNKANALVDDVLVSKDRRVLPNAAMQLCKSTASPRRKAALWCKRQQCMRSMLEDQKPLLRAFRNLVAVEEQQGGELGLAHLRCIRTTDPSKVVALGQIQSAAATADGAHEVAIDGWRNGRFWGGAVCTLKTSRLSYGCLFAWRGIRVEAEAASCRAARRLAKPRPDFKCARISSAGKKRVAKKALKRAAPSRVLLQQGHEELPCVTADGGRKSRLGAFDDLEQMDVVCRLERRTPDQQLVHDRPDRPQVDLWAVVFVAKNLRCLAP